MDFKELENRLEFGGELCPKCNGKGKITVWNGSIHDPKDPETITCPLCKGKGRVIYYDEHPCP